jgi:hypothetical protein
MRQSEEPACFGKGVGEAIIPAAQRDEIEKIAMLPRCRILPVTGRAFAGQRPDQADVEAAPRRVGDIADDPVTALAAAVGEVMAADRLGILREAVGDLGSIRRHDGSLLIVVIAQ